MDTNESFIDIANELQNHHSIFSMMWNLGRPVMSDKVERAAVGFNREGACVQFVFNPEFLEKLTMEDTCFVVAHECMHVILNHGKRLKGLHKDVGNIAADITINEMLLGGFGFKPSDWLMDDICTMKSVFGEGARQLQSNREFEYYYEKMMANATIVEIAVAGGKGKGKDGEDLPGFHPLDDHSDMPDSVPSEIKEIIEAISQEEAKELESKLQRGDGDAYTWVKQVLQPAPKKDWQDVIKNWTIKQYREKKKTQWKLLDRRFVTIQARMRDVIIPTIGPVDERLGHRIDMTFFMDVSGSCAEQSQRFFAAAKTIPRDKFIITPFAFNTGLIPVNIDDDKLPVGGGTCFHQMEEYLLSLPVYPSCVFCLTDGMGTQVMPKYPDRWHVFLTEDYKHCFPPEVNFYDFENFTANRRAY